ncbi:piwi-like protein Ago3 [Neocloeon triangulifer]|uniref:piwi-like protein Ago3 n=1 Tax=Neocloeon triangulifer TaxID=2078957 RepID=UPI00286F185F|nr:piwi-like protein Ago3 [Neocloeon triangulifer]
MDPYHRDVQRGRGRGQFGQTNLPNPTGVASGSGPDQKYSSGYGSDGFYSTLGSSSIDAASCAGDDTRKVIEVAAPDHDTRPSSLLGRGRGIVESQLRQEAKIGTRSLQTAQQPIENLMGKLSLEKIESLPQQEPILKHGVHGQSIDLCTNYIHLNLIQDFKGVYEYEVQFEPQVDALYVRFELLKQLKDFIGTTKTFDGVMLYLPFPFEQEANSFDLQHPFDGSDVNVKIVLRKKQAMRDCIQLYNVLLKRIMTELKLARLGRHFFDPRGAKLIPQHKLEVWPGYVTAIDEYEGGLLLCCDTSSRVLRTQTVLELMYEVSMKARERFQTEMKNMLLGACVLTRYNNRLYRIDDIDFSLNPTCTFDRYNGGSISFKEYYLKHYNLEIKDLSQPMLMSRIKKKQKGMETLEQIVVLVPELCFMTGLTDEMRNDFKIMKDIAVYTRVTPNQRHYALRQFVNSVRGNANAAAMLASWGLELDSKTVELQGRVVDRERIILGDAEIDSGPAADWGNQLSRGRAFEAVDLKNWIVLHCPRDERCVRDLIINMLKMGPQMGCKIESPDLVPLPDDRTTTYVEALRDVIDGDTELQLVLIMFPSTRDDRYAAVKKICCSELPIASQVVISRTLSRPDRVRSIVQKIALQINCKIGGSLWSIKNPYKGCMVVGIDVANQKGQPSVTGFVSSLNPALTHWFSKVAIQNSTQTMSNALQPNFIKALQRYHAANGALPDRIFVYRDGLGAGMMYNALEWEVQQIKDSFQKLSSEYSPKLSFIVVQKKPSTRLFAVKGNNLDNPPPGTIVDHTINERYKYDFFLVSQNVRQGTVSPSHYIVLYDNSSISPDHVQRFSYKLCHMYYNWPGTVRVPAPCQYANKLATLVCMHTKREHHTKLDERLFFL